MTDADKQAIEAVRARFPVLFNAGDFEELGQWFYSSDAVALPPGHELIRGRVEICSFFRELWANEGLRFDLDVIETVAEGDIGYLVGTYVAHMGGKSVKGLTHESYRRMPDGTWKCVVDMWHDAEP